MKIIITGGAGFIGSHLCERLLNDGHSVVVIDNFVTGDKANLDAIGEQANFELVEHDVCLPSYDELDDAEMIYHLASPASPVDYREIPLQTLWVNAAGTKNMLDLAARNDIPIVIASTSEVYGDPLEHPQKESYLGNVNPIGERSCYDEGKRFAESLAINYYKQFGFPLKIVRIFNTYGPRMRKHDGRVIPEFINRAIEGEPLIVHGDGEQTRSFCYVDDMVEGLIKVANTEEAFTGPVNLGNPQEVTINELAGKIIELVGSESVVSHAHKPEDDPMQRCPDISLAEETFGFKPKIGLDEGLKKTIDYFRR